jgi:hypothetical protein
MSAATAHRSFYDAALTEAERSELGDVRGIQGLEDEIAILRLRLREALAEHPDDLQLIERGVRLLVQSLLAEHRLSSREARGLTDAVTAVFEQLAGTLREAIE